MKQIKDCLNPRLIAMCRKSVHLQQLQEQCLQFLNADLRAHCQVSQFSEGRLVIAVSDPVWATALRYELPALRDHLRSEAKLYQLRAIDIKIGFSSQPWRKAKSARKPNCLQWPKAHCRLWPTNVVLSL